MSDGDAPADHAAVTVESEIQRYLRTGESDPMCFAWPGKNAFECAQRADAELLAALIAPARLRFPGLS